MVSRGWTKPGRLRGADFLRRRDRRGQGETEGPPDSPLGLGSWPASGFCSSSANVQPRARGRADTN